ncbi:MAG: trypsin-like peptidase domain-containing protein [Oscillospiraceae bacterium]|jgi:serine protease Do|nr:trypsin-like peptidase domain-containing protein [Oscillospiraceae bacterium]
MNDTDFFAAQEEKPEQNPRELPDNPPEAQEQPDFAPEAPQEPPLIFTQPFVQEQPVDFVQEEPVMPVSRQFAPLQEAAVTPPAPTYPQQSYAVPSYVQQSAPPRKPRKKKKSHLAASIVAVALCSAVIGSIGGGLIVGNVMQKKYADEDRAQVQPRETQTVNASIKPANTSDLLTPAQIYAGNVSAVVGIANEGTTRNAFGQVTESASSGSGFIISPDGEILTNYHVVEDAQTLTVTLYDGRRYEAEIVGYEADSDVALLKIDETNLPCVALGDSTQLEVGAAVAAIGNPLGELTYSMTVGYVSAIGRAVTTDGLSAINMMQIDAAINSGNSGGPLFDMFGNVVGITSAKYSGTTSSGTSIEGIGFAIPIDDVEAILNELRTDGRVERAYLNITARDVDSDDAEFYNLPNGAQVASVTEGGCADRAGMEKGDIIVELDGKTVSSMTELSMLLKNYRAGDAVRILVYREGETLELSAVFDVKPTNDVAVEEETEPTQSWEDAFPWSLWP